MIRASAWRGDMQVGERPEDHNIDHVFRRENLRGSTPQPIYSGTDSFARRKYTSELAGLDITVTGLPLDTATSNRPGARFGPRVICAASTQIAWARPYNRDFDPLDELSVIDCGDCYIDHCRLDRAPVAIAALIAEILAGGGALALEIVALFAASRQ